MPLKRFLTLWAPVIAYMVVVFWGQTSPNVPEPPGGLTDKHEHFFLYGVLAVLALRALANAEWRRIMPRMVLGAIAISSAYGVGLEFYQRTIPGRSFEVLDMIADAIGSALAAGLVWAWSIISRRTKTPDVL